MGYYASVRFKFNTPIIDTAKLDKFHRQWADDTDTNIYGFYRVQLITEGNQLKNIQVQNPNYEKFYDDKTFAISLSQILTDGEVILLFYGEDGERWGYSVKPNAIEILISIFIFRKDLETLENYEIPYFQGMIEEVNS